VLASWKALRLNVNQVDHAVTQISRVLQEDPQEVLRTVERCQLAGLLIDGGITAVADGWLSNHVGNHLGKSKKKGSK
jgi:hypothetical protein